MTPLYELDQIKAALERMDLTQAIEEGFKAYSQNQVVVPPVGELVFDTPPGDTHIKYGYIKEDDYFVIKIASGFYDNPKIDLPSSSGLMLLFNQKTGFPVAILNDQGHLTNVRTALAGRITAQQLAPKSVTAIGVFGTGIQGRLQVEYLKTVTPCRKVVAWGKESTDFESYVEEMTARGFEVETTTDAATLARQCNLIITATPSREPLLFADMLRPGTHITAMGSDTAEKQELDSAILGAADIVVGDSLEQCQSRGEIFQATTAGHLAPNKAIELGQLLMNPDLGRSSDDQLTVADLTGVAVQDIQITKAVYQALSSRS